MSEAEFWQLIGLTDKISSRLLDSSFFRNFQETFIKRELEKKGVESIIEFQNHLNKKIFNLFQPKIAEIYLVPFYAKRSRKKGSIKYVSVDGFIDFRAWIVGLGREHYDIFLNFKKEEELLKYNLDCESAYRGGIPFLTMNVLDKLEVKESNINYVFNGNKEDLILNIDWDNLDNKYPKLTHRYSINIDN